MNQGPTTPRKRPRRCVGCGKEQAKVELIRVVRSPSGTVSVNAAGKAPGRGAYICPSLACVSLAKKKNALSKALKISLEQDIYRQLEEMCVDD